MLVNTLPIQDLIRRMRLKEGVGSEEDELILHRVLQDITTLKTALGLALNDMSEVE